MAVSIECKNDTLRIRIPRREFDHSELLKLLSDIDDDFLFVKNHFETEDGFEAICKICDVEELKCAIDRYYEIYHTELYPFEEIKCYVESQWDKPEWRVEMTLEELDEKSWNEVRREDWIEFRRNIVFALVSNKRTPEECDTAIRRLDRILARKYGFCLRGYWPECNRTEYAVSYIYRIPYIARHFEYVTKTTHIYDCECPDDLGEVINDK